MLCSHSYKFLLSPKLCSERLYFREILRVPAPAMEQIMLR